MGQGLAGLRRSGYLRGMSLFAPKYLAAQPFELTHVPGLDQRVEYLRQWQARIRSGRVHKSKEVALQADFLNEIFGDALGYDHQDAHLWYLEKELKSNTDGTQADGGLGYFRQVAGQRTQDVRVVMELKDARTDLDKPQNRATDRRTPVEQAFGYASKVGGCCRWVVVSNFVELRLYPATDQSQYESFDLGTLPDSLPDLARFFRLLLREQLLLEHGESYTDHLYRVRQEQERRISEEFYGEYKQARLDLLAHLREQNPAVDDLLLFNKAQKLLDRVVFVCFCEDKNIIPALTFRGLLRAVHEDKFNRSDAQIYERVKNLFRAIDEGFPDAGINKFNGGLFAPDADLDNLRIRDAILQPIIALEVYDFDSDLNVNILGHIFEQNIADIEELKAQLAPATGAAAPAPAAPRLSKRKKDGIFYTPEYITRYMVREAVGGWLHQRYQQAGIEALPPLPSEDVDVYGKALPGLPAARKGALTKLLARHLAAWQQYRQALLNIRVLDPACGSGAFLNQVFDYLHQEGQRVNRELARLSSTQTTLFDLDKHILTHNLFGVDLNAESVEITRLSLWLKTANKYNPLTALDDNIRVGNSLIADPAVAGELAFDWDTEFAEVMGGGGFDVVIGNPPYGYLFTTRAQFDYINSAYQTAEYKVDAYTIFFERGINLLTPGGYCSFISPYTFLTGKYFSRLREFLIEYQVREIMILGQKIFPDAEVDTAITVVQKGNYLSGDEVFINDLRNEQDISDLAAFKLYSIPGVTVFSDIENQIIIGKPDAIELLAKLNSNERKMKDVSSFYHGIQSKGDDKAIVNSSIALTDLSAYPLLKGGDFNRYRIQPTDKFFLFKPENIKSGGKLEFHQVSPKVIIRTTGDSIIATIDENQYLVLNSVNILMPKTDSADPFVLLAILNSRLMKFWYDMTVQESGKTFAEVKIVYLERIPIPIGVNSNSEISDKVKALLALTAQVQQQRQAFLTFLQVKLGLAAPSRKLQGWNALSWDVFAAELKKAKVVLTLAQEAEWLPLLQQRQQALRLLTQQLATQDRALDQRVYTLYGLTPAEIALVEGPA